MKKIPFTADQRGFFRFLIFDNSSINAVTAWVNSVRAWSKYFNSCIQPEIRTCYYYIR